MNDFLNRFLLARYKTGGVVVDLESGNYYLVNATAAVVCDAIRAGGDVEGRSAAELAVPREEAARIVADVVAGLRTPAIRRTPQGSYHFYSAEGGYVLTHGERTVLEVSGLDMSIRLPAGGRSPHEAQLELYVRALAPKLLFQRGVTVLHASACIAAGQLIAFAGVSGAGKTTTAQAFVLAGAHPVSEDLLVLVPGAPHAEVLTDAEPLIQMWARRVSGELLDGRGGPVSSDELAGVVKGSTLRLNRILFLDKSRRSGLDLKQRPLDPSEALATLMTHDFLGAKEVKEWQRFFEAAVELIAVTDAEEATAPEGVDRLLAAATSYISRIAS
jgi:hypothetical protein